MKGIFLLGGGLFMIAEAEKKKKGGGGKEKTNPEGTFNFPKKKEG